MKPLLTSFLVVFTLALDVTVGGIVQPASPARAAVSAPAIDDLYIRWAGNGGGMVNYRYSSTSGSCTSGSSCNINNTINGSTVTITATAYSISSTFTSWTNCDSTSGTDDSVCRINSGTSYGSKTITATFTLKTNPISVTISGSGSVTSTPSGISCTTGTCAHSFDYGTPVTLTAAANTGWTFASWSGGLCNGSAALTCTTTLTTTKSVTANFTINTYPVSVTISGSGLVTSTPSGISCTTGTCSHNFNYNTPITLTALANTGYSFAGWNGAGCSGTGTCNTTVTSARNITATFNLITHTLTVTKTGNGSGAITSDPSGIDCGETCSASFDYGTVVTLTANPDTGSLLSSWGGDCSVDGLSCVTTMTAAKDITATFSLITYTVTANKDGNGSGTITSDPSGIDCGETCNADFDYNTVVTLTAAPDDGSTLTGWEGDCAADGLSCTTTVTGTRDVTATFTLITYTVSVTKTGNGSGAITSDPSGIDCGETCSASFDYTSTVTLTASADTGSTFMGWEGDCVGTVPCVVTIDAAKNVTATFSLVTYTLTVHKDGEGVGTVTSDPTGIDCGLTCTVAYDYGTVVTLTQQTVTGTAFGGWGGDCNGTGLCVVTIVGNQSVTATFNLITTDLGVSQNVTRSTGLVTFTVVITNGGPSDADGTIVSDTVTSQIGNPQWNCQAANGASCPATGLLFSMGSSDVYSIYDTLPLFPAGGVVTYTISGDVGLLAQRLTNSVQVIAPTGVTDVSEPDDSSSIISGFRVMFPVVMKGQ